MYLSWQVIEHRNTLPGEAGSGVSFLVLKIRQDLDLRNLLLMTLPWVGLDDFQRCFPGSVTL